MDDHILEQMDNMRYRGMMKLSKVIPEEFLDEFTDVLCYAYRDGVLSAEKIANDMGFDLLDIYALHDDQKGFEREYIVQMNLEAEKIANDMGDDQEGFEREYIDQMNLEKGRCSYDNIKRD